MVVVYLEIKSGQWYLEVSMTVSVLVQQSQDIRRRPRLAAAQIVEREEKLEVIADSSGGLECEILLSNLENGVCQILKYWRHSYHLR